MITLNGKIGKSCKIFSDDLEEGTKNFLSDLLDSEVSRDVDVRVMPDQHYGTSCIVGLTLPIHDILSPEHIGCDIGCGVRVVMVGTGKKMPPTPDLVEMRIRREIPEGPEVHKKPVIDEKHLFKFLRSEYSKARASHPELIEDFEITEASVTKMLRRLGMDKGLWYKSLGTLGGGNHFIEVSLRPGGGLAVVVHTGSRNFGIKVWKYWSRVAKSHKPNPGKLKEVESRIREKYTGPEIAEKIKDLHDNPGKYGASCGAPTGYLEGENLKGYLRDMVIAQAYAKYNRRVITDTILGVMAWSEEEVIESIHNYIDFDRMILRKGAISAEAGEKVVIPLNMAVGTIVGEGLGNPDWNWSAPHGAGRAMSRSRAYQELNMEDYKESMMRVYSTSVCLGTLDESPAAYKSPGMIVEAIEPTVHMDYLLRPWINIKAVNDSIERAQED
jgi:RNA-splicing ligase RtcB